jgi:hypothetical protein
MTVALKESQVEPALNKLHSDLGLAVAGDEGSKSDQV